MSDGVAEAAIDTLIRESAGRPKIHVTFFGGETLLNFPVMQHGVAYAKKKPPNVARRSNSASPPTPRLLTEEIVGLSGGTSDWSYR